MMLRPLLTLLSGGAVRQVVAFAALPLLARLYDPEAFGLLGAIMALVSLTAVIVHGRFHLAIAGSETDAEARTLLRLAVAGTFLLATPVTAGAWLVFGSATEAFAVLAAATALTLVFALSDVFDALVSDRPYRKSYSPREAAALIRDSADSHFDPEIVPAFLEFLDTIVLPRLSARPS